MEYKRYERKKRTFHSQRWTEDDDPNEFPKPKTPRNRGNRFTFFSFFAAFAFIAVAKAMNPGMSIGGLLLIVGAYAVACAVFMWIGRRKK